ncbi:histidine kinase [Fibrella sp. HMF5335]|uniref:Histidine kinase n=1 Tax=Fibrella rubiginis TaxID=2817060 RepID=A0A939K234_9BACT|nr:histidine kinase [Fibrella rubiginis]MBO0935889.1 histidine kinase [Fibrella rubiginis]
MAFDTWNDLFVGMVASILLLNVVQWFIYRERIYGLYTLYMLVWLFFYGVRMPLFSDRVSENTYSFIKAGFPSLAYFIYFDFADAFLQVRRHQPGLFRLFQFGKAIVVPYIALQLWVCFLASVWHPALFNTAHTAVRVTLALVAIYSIARLFQYRTMAARYFVTGSICLVAGGLTSMVLTFIYPVLPDDIFFWQAPIAYFQIGILGELLCFSLGLSYRQRRAAVKTALVEQELAQEREKRHREQLESELSVQRLRQEMSEVQMRALQAHLNPHFLFNSLNTLSSLIADDAVRAEVFVDEMASVYRYVLQTNAQELTTLERELAFIDSYFHLLETRYGRGIRLNNQVDAVYLPYLIPPLTLQLLVENTVKHNVILADQPLTISILTNERAQLVVRNNLQRKQVRVASNGVGLSNILTKYQMMAQPVPVIEERDGHFDVTLPLIEPAGSNGATIAPTAHR